MTQPHQYRPSKSNRICKGTENNVYLDIVAYNVAGLKSKIYNVEFVEFLRKFQLFMLFECFIVQEDVFLNFKKKFNNYDLVFQPAVKQSRYGRASGGSIYGIKKDTATKDKIKFVQFSNVDLIEINSKFGNHYILPVYLNCNSWQSDFNSLYDFLNKYQNLQFLLIGDLNGRISNEQNVPEGIILGSNAEIQRKSKDQVINSNGQYLLSLFEEFNLMILNGRVKGDLNGEYTFIGAMGCSVIDLCAISVDLISYVEFFQVCKQHFSDHLPIALKYVINGVMNDNVLPVLPKLKWKPNCRDEYVKEIGSLVCKPTVNTKDAIVCVKQLTDLITTVAYKYNMFYKDTASVYKQCWFDGECQKVRKVMYGLLNIFRRTSSPAIKSYYLKIRNKYKTLCNSKKKNYTENIINEFNNVKDAQDFWNMVRHFKYKKYNCDKNISTLEWVDHFKNLLNPPLNATRIAYAEPYVVDDLLDAPFEMRDLLWVLDRAKNNKAPGTDRIAYEFFKNSPESFLQTLLKCFNEIYNTGEAPSGFKNAILFPIHKKGSINDVSNYRGISFSNTVGKLFTGLL